MNIKVTCVGCHGAFQTSIPKESWDQYQDGAAIEDAFEGVSENAINLAVHKACPKCIEELTEDSL